MKKNKICLLIITGLFILTSIIPVVAVAQDVATKEYTSNQDSSSQKDLESNPMVRSLGGVTGRWFNINGNNAFFSPTINLKKDSTDPIVFSKIISQNSGSSYNFSEKILFSDAVSIQALPEIIVPGGTTYSVEYTIDKLTYTNTAPTDITSLKGIKVIFSKMTASQRVEIKNSAILNWNMTHSGANELAQYFEDNRLEGTIYFDSYRMVTAVYTDELGVKLSEPEVLYGTLGEGYSTSIKKIPGYALKEIPDNAFGRFDNDDQTVSYVYEKEIIAGGDVTVKYVDSNGNRISDDEVKSGNIGEDYSTEQKDITGYTFKEVQANAQGKFTDQPQTVTYVYNQNSVAGNITYLDESGHTLLAAKDVSSHIGGTFTWSIPEDILGFTVDLNKSQVITTLHGGPQSLTLKDAMSITNTDSLSALVAFLNQQIIGSGTESVELRYVYTKDPVKGGDITAKYVDTDGKTISDDVVKTGNIGDTYTTEQKAITGYTFKAVQGSASGTFTDKAQTVSYVYTKDGSAPVTPDDKDSKSRSPQQLPTTGEDNHRSLYAMITGIILICLIVVVSGFKLKKNK